MSNIVHSIERCELSIEQLLKLLGGTPDERERFWEIVKGITTPREEFLANEVLVAVQNDLNAAHAALAGIREAGGQG
jgi:hypothetical protein